MKKLVLIIVALFSFASCENPSIEDGLASLETALAELQAAMAGVDVDQMVADLDIMQSQVEIMESQIEGYEIDLTEYTNQINSILADLAELQVILDNAATTEQVNNALADVEAMQETIAILLLIADGDADGIINGLDQCPDTELGATVNEQGCSEEQVAAQTATASSTTTSSTGG